MTAGTPILTAQFADLRLVVEAAFGMPPGTDGPWTDITSYLKSQVVSSTLGRADQTSQTQPAVCGFVLDNATGLFSKGPTGTSAGLEKIPLRVRTVLSGTSYTRFQGEAIGFAPRWNSIGKSPIAIVSAAGSLRRLIGAGRQPPLASTMRHYVLSRPSLVSYWPMEDGSSATSFAAATPGTSAMTSSTGLPRPASFTGFAASATAPTMGNNEAYTASVNLAAGMSAGGQIWFLINIPQATLADGTRIASIITASTPGLTRIDLIYNVANSGSFSFKGYSGSTLVTSCSATAPLGGANSQDVLLGFDWFPPGGGTLNLEVDVIGLADPNLGLYAGGDGPTMGPISGINSIVFAPDGNCSGVAIGHLYVQNVKLDLPTFTVPSAATGFNGETVTDRLTRLTAEQGEIITITGSSTQTMGPQPITDFVSALRECEAVDLGVLYDGAGRGLSYIARSSRENQTATLVLDAAAGDIVDMLPTDDDLGTVNSFQASRINGSTVTYTDTDTTSALSVPNAGDHADSAQINSFSDSYLLDYASFRVNLGEVPGYRYPNLSLAIHSAPRILSGWLATPIGGRATVKNLATVRLSDDPRDRDVMVEGWTESIDKYSWTIGVNSTSYDPWRIGTLAADAGDVGEFLLRLSPDSSTVAVAAAAGATTLSVSTPSGPLWVTGSGDDFPMALDVGGLRVVCNSISGTTSPQTFNVVATALKIPAGARVDVWTASRLSL